MPEASPADSPPALSPGSGAPGAISMPLAAWSVELADSPFAAWLAHAATLNELQRRGVEEQAAWRDLVEESVAACMAAEGFEYVPSEDVAAPVFDQSLSTVDHLAIPALPGTRGEVEQVGYGVDDIDAMEAMLAQEGVVDVNTAYAESLGEAGRHAFYLALTGHDGTEQSDEGGCAGRVLAQLPQPGVGDPSARYFEQYAPLLGEMARFSQDVVAHDARTVALDVEWASCMAEAGHDLVAAFDLTGPSPLSAVDLAVRTRPDGSVGDPQPDTPTSEIPFDERYLTGDPAERAVALADFDCRAATNYLERLTTIQIDLEEEFVHARAQALEEMAATLTVLTP